MNYQLIYSVAEHSNAPMTAAVFGAGLGAVALISAAVVWNRGGKIGTGVKFFIIASTLMLIISVMSVVEKRVIASKTQTEGKVAEGAVVQHWTSWERSASSSNSYWYYEGFYVNGVHFSYTTNLSNNYFNNSGPRKVDIKDGMRVRVHYLEEASGEKKRNQITRFEIAEGGA